ncbi:MAG TPA: response regulator [Candidatus Tectomicrobia bacterium]
MANILLVDDTPTNLELLESLCRYAGHTTRHAATVEAGLTLARAHRPDLIISDIHMAPLDGYDLLRTAKADPQLASIPVILVSMSGGHGVDQRKALNLGAAKFIPMPAEPQILLEEIQACLGISEASDSPGHA